MVNHALIAVQIPGHPQRLALVETWLERCSGLGIELICFMPSLAQGFTIAVMTTPDRANVPPPPHW